MESVILLAGSLLGGGALATIVTTLVNRNKSKADTLNTNIMSLLEIDARMQQRLTSLEDRVGRLYKENEQLHDENTKLREKVPGLGARTANNERSTT